MHTLSCPACHGRFTDSTRGSCPTCGSVLLVLPAETADPPTLVSSAGDTVNPDDRASPRGPAAAVDPTLVQLAPPEEPGPNSVLAPPRAPDELGRLGRYRVLKLIGQGGMGVVYLAEDPALDRLVALKVMRPQVSAEADAAPRFLHEARATARITSDHIVTIYDVGADRGVPFLAMELLRGESLEAWLGRGKAPTLPQLLRIGRDVCRGLAAAHSEGLVHRDVKPANLWLEAPNGRVKILDFGLARNARADIRLTQSGAVGGTPAYMAPEQVDDSAVDARADLFSVGSVLYRLCTGREPFPGETMMARLVALATQDPVPVRTGNPDVPEALAALVHRLLAKDPAARPPTARAVLEELVAIDRDALDGPASGSITRRPGSGRVRILRLPDHLVGEPALEPAREARKPRSMVAVAARAPGASGAVPVVRHAPPPAVPPSPLPSPSAHRTNVALAAVAVIAAIAAIAAVVGFFKP